MSFRKEPSGALTLLHRSIEPRVAANGGRSGFRLLPTGLDAFVARAHLIELAEQTLDLQYYIFHADTTGSLVIDRLIAAADRGVRVRLLLDDWGTLEKKDDDVAGLDAHPSIEIRLFNPYRHRSRLLRLAELLTSFTRVNRRMHNKQLIADGIAVVLGGRNIGDEYFSLGELDFQDVDVLAGGPVAGPALATELRTHALHLDWAEAKVIADPPDKLTKPAGTRSDRYLRGQISPYVRAVRSELLVVSPYFVPGKEGVSFFGERRRGGVNVRVLTNSLAATDVWLVHAGYMKYRRPLLDEGVRLYELRPEAAGGGTTRPRAKAFIGSSRASLHGKTFVFDRTSVFIGSVNLDPRSLELNTEDGVLVSSAELAGHVAELFERWSSPALAYEVTRGRNGGLQWTGGYTDEPEAGFWRPIGAKLFSHLPIDSLI